MKAPIGPSTPPLGSADWFGNLMVCELHVLIGFDGQPDLLVTAVSQLVWVLMMAVV